MKIWGVNSEIERESDEEKEEVIGRERMTGIYSVFSGRVVVGGDLVG